MAADLPHTYLDIDIASQRLRLFPERAVFWQQPQCLLLSDLHLGKADTFRRYGIAVPQSVQHADMDRLERVVAQVRPCRCLVLGDFVHGSTYGADTVARWRGLVARYPETDFEVVLGNHDRTLNAAVWGVSVHAPSVQMGTVLLSHEPLPDTQLRNKLNIHGHIHPAWRAPHSRAKFPALVHQGAHLMMPAFSEFTAGVVPPSPAQRVWAFLTQEGAVLQVC